MIKLTVVAATLVLTGCAASHQPLPIKSPYTYGLKDYDPCIRCGEGWIFLNIDQTRHLKEK